MDEATARMLRISISRTSGINGELASIFWNLRNLAISVVRDEQNFVRFFTRDNGFSLL